MTHEHVQRKIVTRVIDAIFALPLATTIRHVRAYIRGGGEGVVGKSESQKASRRKAKSEEEERKDTWTEPSVTYEYECGIGPYDMQPFAYI